MTPFPMMSEMHKCKRFEWLVIVEIWNNNTLERKDYKKKKPKKTKQQKKKIEVCVDMVKLCVSKMVNAKPAWKGLTMHVVIIPSGRMKKIYIANSLKKNKQTKKHRGREKKE